MTEEEKQNLEELLRLMADNPELPVVPMVDSEIAVEDAYGRWLGAWGSVYIGEYFEVDGQAYFRDDTDQSSLEFVLEEMLGYDTVQELTDEEAVAAYASMPWIKAIIVYIDAPAPKGGIK
ncbi:MAG: hypothetical protein Q4C48_08890 [Lachnospiraceae bacterium]|nr:hypothetical protein [Lachnospiraceae bacterium]